MKAKRIKGRRECLIAGGSQEKRIARYLLNDLRDDDLIHHLLVVTRTLACIQKERRETA